jgi:hypothetical protein
MKPMKPFYNVAVSGVFTDEGTDCQTKAIDDAMRTLLHVEHASDGQPLDPVTVVLSGAISADPQHSGKALGAYERIRSALMLGYPNPHGMDATSCFDLRLADLLADVLHFCDVDGLDYADVERAAREHYDEERDPAYDG